MKTMSIFISTILLLFSFVGCGGGSSDKTDDETKTLGKESPNESYTAYDKDYVGIGLSDLDNEDTKDTTVPKNLMQLQKEYQLKFGNIIIAQENNTKVKFIIHHRTREMKAVLLNGSAEIK